jgi:hypothetical protein
MAATTRPTVSSRQVGGNDNALAFERGAEHGSDEVAVDALGVEGVLQVGHAMDAVAALHDLIA